MSLKRKSLRFSCGAWKRYVACPAYKGVCGVNAGFCFFTLHVFSQTAARKEAEHTATVASTRAEELAARCSELETSLEKVWVCPGCLALRRARFLFM